jgi:hypothetical protein
LALTRGAAQRPLESPGTLARRPVQRLLGRPWEFAPFGRENVPKSLLDPPLVKTNLNDSINVRKLFYSFLQQNDRAGEAETSLKEAELVSA